MDTFKSKCDAIEIELNYALKYIQVILDGMDDISLNRGVYLTQAVDRIRNARSFLTLVRNAE